MLCTSSYIPANDNDSIIGNSYSKAGVSNPDGQKIGVKFSAFLAIAIINPAIEIKLHKTGTFQFEGLGIFYSTNFLGTKKPLVLGASFFEYRYYYKGAFKGFYFGSDIGWVYIK